MNGKELGERLQLTRPGLHAPYMTGYTDSSVIETAGDVGATETGFARCRRYNTPAAR
jgi:hypothetical protein